MPTTALVVDDSRHFADTLCDMLNLIGVAAKPAYGAREAMFVLAQQTPGVLFLDLNMPGLGGFEIMAYLRREPRLASLPVVVVTSDDQPETAKKAHNLGAIDLIVKPASFVEIERVLRQLKLI